MCGTMLPNIAKAHSYNKISDLRSVYKHIRNRLQQYHSGLPSTEDCVLAWLFDYLLCHSLAKRIASGCFHVSLGEVGLRSQHVGGVRYCAMFQVELVSRRQFVLMAGKPIEYWKSWMANELHNYNESNLVKYLPLRLL